MASMRERVMEAADGAVTWRQFLRRLIAAIGIEANRWGL